MQQIRANLVISNYFKLVQIGSNFNKQEFCQKALISKTLATQPCVEYKKN